MGLFRLPFLPVRGVIKLGELIQKEVEQELYDPARIRRELEDAERRRDAGEISDEEFTRIEDELTALLVPGAASSSGPGTGPGAGPGTGDVPGGEQR